MPGPQLSLREYCEALNILSSGKLAMGAKVAQFEMEISKYLGKSQHVIALNSGTSALHLGLLAMNLDPTDEVIVPAFTFAATANAVVMAGATPVLADVNLETMTLDKEKVQALITARTKAVIFVSLFGNMSGYSEVAELCKKSGVALIEDAAQSFGSTISDQPSGSLGHWSALSFYPTKNITTIEGGAVCTSDDELAHKVRLLRNQGMLRKYENEIPGLNNRMTEISAGIGLIQLKRLAGFLQRRKALAAAYRSQLESVSSVLSQRIDSDVVSSYNQFTVRVLEDRDRVREALLAKGIQTQIYYPKAVSDLDSFKHMGYEAPNSRILTSQVLSLPIGPSISQREAKLVARELRSLSI